ncbi:unnamed protein product [Lymnaea stagnalis]|uniref:Thromboxane A2 receptor n=1 Tax=Lymnaea stagnalis TaxID=6523 RepID=A0AAV2HVG9_LYMST
MTTYIVAMENLTTTLYNHSVDRLGLNVTGAPATADGRAIREASVLASCLMFTAGLVGNALALTLMATAPPEQKRTMFYKLMAGLAFTDLVGTCATSPVVISIYATGTVLRSEFPLCHYFSFMMIFAGFATMSLVCAMAIERYISLCHPYAYHCKLPKSYAKYAILFSWLLSLLIACLPLMGLGHNTVQFPKTWCFFNSTSRAPKDVAFNFIYAIISLLAIIVTVLCNLAVIFTVMALRRRQKALNATQFPGIKRYRSLAQRFAELHMVVMLTGVTIVFTFCFAPLMVFTIICQTDVIKYINIDKTYLPMIRLASFNPILDPWVYLLVRRELRWKMICLFRSIFGMRQESAVTSPVKMAESPVFPRAPQQKEDPEMSLCTFCFRCLCDPPVQRQSSATWGGACSRSPSYSRRIPSSDSLLPGACVIGQPSPSEELFLRKFSPNLTEPNDNTVENTGAINGGLTN